MNRELESRAAAILDQLIAVPESDRSSLLNELTQDAPELRPVVESLSAGWSGLLSEQGASEGHPISHTATLDQPIDPQATQLLDTFGTGPAGTRFTPQSKLGEGGQGEVWLAFDPQLDREVALKVVRRDQRGSRTLREKFRQEAVVTGKLEHPGIVPIYEAGRHAACEGSSEESPFYVMRVCRNRTLDQAISDFHRGEWSESRLRELLHRFIDVCNAVGYAHSRGVIHRDLKPQNVMLGEFGETLVVDWGLAKVVGRGDIHADSDSGGTVHMVADGKQTVPGSILGTPQYMSPEQARGEIASLGPATDIYGLGAILYQLLCGQPPVQAESVQATLEHVRAGRINAPETHPSVPKALSAICLRALANQPVDRYRKAEVSDDPTEATLAGDITRWLNDEPVIAFSDPLLSRVRRWMRRHQTFTATTAVAALVAVVTLSVMFFAVNDRNEQLKTQREAAVASQKLADEQRQLAEAHAETASEQTQLAISTLNTVIFDIQRGLKNVPRTAEVRKKALTTALESLNQIAGEFADDRTADLQASAVLIEIADIALTIGLSGGDVQEDDASPQSAVQLALTQYQSANEILRSLALENPSDRQTQRYLSISYEGLGKVQLRRGNDQEALVSYRKALEISKSLVHDDPENREARRDLSVSYEGYGDAHLAADATDNALENYEKCREIRQQLVESDSDNSQALHDLAVVYERLGKLELQRGLFPEARVWFEKELVVARERFRLDPLDDETKRFVMVVHENLGKVGRLQGSVQQDVDERRRELESRRQLAYANPGEPQFQRELMFAHLKLGKAEYDRYAYAAASRQYHQGIAILDGLTETGRDSESDARSRDYLVQQALRAELAVTATTDWSSLIEEPDDELPILLEIRCTEFAKQGRLDEVERAAGELRVLSRDAADGGPGILYNSARAFGMCALALEPEEGTELSAEQRARRQEFLDVSVACLKEAIDAGFGDFERMREDPALKALHDLPQFLEILPAKADSADSNDADAPADSNSPESN